MKHILTVLLVVGPLFECYAADTPSVTYGVTVKTITGIMIEGYIDWKAPVYEGLDAAFDQWIASFSKPLGQRAAKENQPALRIFREIRQIRYPAERYVIIAEGVVDLPRAEITSIAANPQLTIRTNPIGLPTMTDQNAKLLTSKAPRYIVEVGQDMTTIFVVYGEKVRPKELLWHITRGIYEYGEPSLKVNDVRVFPPGHPGIYKGIDDLDGSILEDERREIKEYVREFHRFMDENREATASCRAEDSRIWESVRIMNMDDPLRESRMKNAVAHSATCRKIETEVLNRYSRDLGDATQLSKLGVISYSYNWD